MGHIFISYSHKDTDYAHGLANNLQNIGFEIWIDERLDYGSQWPQEIQKQLDTCDAFIIIMSPRSFASEWVQSELQRAKRKLKPIFPLLLEGDEPWLSIESTQFYDVRGAKFPDAKFYSAIKRVVPVSQNARTFHALKEPKKMEPVANPSAPKRMSGVAIAAISAGVIICAACAIISIGLFGSSLMKRSLPGPVQATVTLTLNPSPTTDQPTLAASPTFSPTETLIPTLTPTETFVPTLPPPPTAEPVVVTNSYHIEKCCGDFGTQRSDPLDYTITVRTVDFLQIEYSLTKGCSDVFFHILWDDNEIYTTERMGPVSGRFTSGSIELSPYISQGRHKLTISPEGVVGGCNTGALGSWGGDLIVHTNEYP